MCLSDMTPSHRLSNQCERCQGLLGRDVLKDHSSGEHCAVLKCVQCSRVAQWGPVLGVQWTLQQ